MSFTCHIINPSFSINIEYNEFKTIEDLKKKIGDVLCIDSTQFEIINPPSEEQIKKSLDRSKINISIKNCQKDVKFHMNDGKTLTIPNCNKMKFFEVVDFLKNKGYRYYFTFTISGKETLRYVPFPFFAVPNDSFVDTQKKSNDHNYNIRNKPIQGNPITLTYDQKKFTFSENSFVSKAYNLILSSFKKYTKINLISIINVDTKERIIGGYQLKNTEKYIVQILVPLTFRIKNQTDYKSYQHFDFFDKISVAKQRLAFQLSIKITLKPENIIIYGKDGKETNDDDQFLREIRDSQENVYFEIKLKPKKSSEKVQKNDQKETKDEEKQIEKSTHKTNIFSKSQIIKSMKFNPLNKKTKNSDSDENNQNSSIQTTKNSQQELKQLSESENQSKSNDEIIEEEEEPEPESSIKINFIFDENNEQKFKPFSQKVSINTTIEKLDEEISNKFDIDTKILIEYKDGPNKVAIDRDMTIEDVIEDIQNENENVLYIKITQKPKTIKSTRPKKTTTITHQEPNMTKSMKPESKSLKTESEKEQENYKKTSVQKTKKQPENEIEEEEDFVEPVKTTKNDDKKHFYCFEYEEDEKEINLNPESFLEDNEQKIKKEFGLKESDQIEFNIHSKEEEEEEIIELNKRKMKTLKNFTIQIFVHNKQNKTKTSESKDSNKKYKYYYKTNQDDEINEIELEKGTTVKDFKKIMRKDNEVENLSDIKIIFAGKDLLNDIVLDELNVGDTVLFIYIRTTQDILLMTAKALQFKKEDLEEESESDTDDD